MDFNKFIEEQLDTLDAQNQLRKLNTISDKNGLAVLDGKEMLNLSSNDYLGLASEKKLREEFFNDLAKNPCNENYKLSASSSRLLTGNHRQYRQTELLLSQMYQGREAVIFNSGYHANLGILPAIAGKNDIILSDKLNHASIIDGCQLADAKLKRYRHLDYDHLENLLESGRDDYRNAFIITESLFSMDGDIADIQRLIEIKKKYNCVLIVDEAHSIGVFGEKGLGLCEVFDAIDDIDIIVATFGKAICSSGACVITNSTIKQYLINKMRPIIFTTALPPITLSWTSFVLERIADMNSRREHLKKISEKLRDGLKLKGYQTMGNSQIVPLIVGDNAKTLTLAKKLQDAGLLVFAIRPPTVPPKTARIRFSLGAHLTESDIDKILNNL